MGNIIIRLNSIVSGVHRDFWDCVESLCIVRVHIFDGDKICAHVTIMYDTYVILRKNYFSYVGANT